MIEWTTDGVTYGITQDKVTMFIVERDGLVTLLVGGDKYPTGLGKAQVWSILQGHAQA